MLHENFMNRRNVAYKYSVTIIWIRMISLLIGILFLFSGKLANPNSFQELINMKRLLVVDKTMISMITFILL